jgi:hypothetical protein
MKTSIKTILFVFFISAFLSSCNVNMFNSISGNRNVVTEDRSSKEDFTKIRVSTGLDLYLSQGSKTEITVEADENLQEIIITESKDGVLKIYSEKNIWKAKSRKVYVTVNDLESLSATSGADVYAKRTLKVNNIDIRATSGADIRISLDANSVETSATSGASIDGYDLRSKNVTAKVTSGADINVYASESINAKATSGGDIDFKGSPKQVNKKSSSGGSISAK